MVNKILYTLKHAYPLNLVFIAEDQYAEKTRNAESDLARPPGGPKAHLRKRGTAKDGNNYTIRQRFF